MKEKIWVTCADPLPMLELLNGRPSDRKLHLFACACCGRVNPLLAASARRAVGVAERFADGMATGDELQRARLAVGLARGFARRSAAYAVLAAADSGAHDNRLFWARNAATNTFQAIGSAAPKRADRALCESGARAEFCHLLRDIFGNPFRPVAFRPEWRTDIARALAAQMYEPRDFGAMPILAYALQEAGCDSDDILDHCRGEGPHVRGCWVVDLVLGKQ